MAFSTEWLAKKHSCSICIQRSDSKVEIDACEKQGIYVPYFKIGDDVVFREGIIDEYQAFTGVVKDLLFPVYWHHTSGLKDISLLGHDYSPAYLVESPTRSLYELAQQDIYFDQNQIILNSTRLCVVDDCHMFSKDIRVIDVEDFKFDINTSRKDRMTVANWDEFVAEVIKANPTLLGRMHRLSTHFKSIGVIQT